MDQNYSSCCSKARARGLGISLNKILIAITAGLVLAPAVFIFAQEAAPTQEQLNGAFTDLSAIVGASVTSVEQAKEFCNQERYFDDCAAIGKNHNLYQQEEIKQVDAVLSELRGTIVRDLEACATEECLITVATQLARRVAAKNPEVARDLDLTTAKISEKKIVLDTAKKIGVDFKACRELDPETASVELLRACARLAKDDQLKNVVNDDGRRAADYNDKFASAYEQGLFNGCGASGANLNETLENCGDFCFNPENIKQGESGIPPACLTLARTVFKDEGGEQALRDAYREVGAQVNQVDQYYKTRAANIVFITADGRRLTDPAQIGFYLEGEAQKGNVEVVERGIDFLIANGFVKPEDKEFALDIVRKVRERGTQINFNDCRTSPDACRDFIHEDYVDDYSEYSRLEEIMRRNIGFSPSQCRDAQINPVISQQCHDGIKKALPELDAAKFVSPDVRRVVAEIKENARGAEDRINRSGELQKVFQSQGGPGGCRSEQECHDYCSDSKNTPECIAFGASQGFNGFKGGEAIERFQQYQNTLQGHQNAPPGIYGGFPGQGPYQGFQPPGSSGQPPGQIPGFTQPGPGFTGPPGFSQPVVSPECLSAIQSGDFVSAKTLCAGSACPAIYPQPCPDPINQYRPFTQDARGCTIPSSQCIAINQPVTPPGQPGVCPSLPTVDPRSCQNGAEITFSSPACGTYYKCRDGGTPPGQTECSDGRDNDNDGKIDYPSDPSCYDRQDNDEYYPNNSGQSCPSGTYYAVRKDGTNYCASNSVQENCANGVDDDGDQYIDNEDPACGGTSGGCGDPALNTPSACTGRSGCVWEYPASGGAGYCRNSSSGSGCDQNLTNLLGTGCHQMYTDTDGQPIFCDGPMVISAKRGDTQTRQGCSGPGGGGSGCNYNNVCDPSQGESPVSCSSDCRSTNGCTGTTIASCTSVTNCFWNISCYYGGSATSACTGTTQTSCTSVSGCTWDASSNYCRTGGSPACSDGLDNDSDGLIDYPNDTGCYSSTDTTETADGGGGTPSPAPTGLAFNLGSANVAFTWTDNSTNENAYELWERPSSQGTYARVLTSNYVSGGQGTMTYSNRSSGTYEYYVIACNDSGCSGTSNTVFVTYSGGGGGSSPTSSNVGNQTFAGDSTSCPCWNNFCPSSTPTAVPSGWSCVGSFSGSQFCVERSGSKHLTPENYTTANCQAGKTCNNNRVCEATEDSLSCPGDCSSGGGGSQCSDGIDNDSDGFIDYPADTGCYSSSDSTESYSGGGGGTCSSYTNSGSCEGDQACDWVNQTTCYSTGSYENLVPSGCSNGIDDDKDGLIDSADPACSGGGGGCVSGSHSMGSYCMSDTNSALCGAFGASLSTFSSSQCGSGGGGGGCSSYTTQANCTANACSWDTANNYCYASGGGGSGCSQYGSGWHTMDSSGRCFDTSMYNYREADGRGPFSCTGYNSPVYGCSSSGGGGGSCNYNGTCESNESYSTCPSDCSSGGGGGSQCSDGIDNDADGAVDYPADTGCYSSSDTTESYDGGGGGGGGGSCPTNLLGSGCHSMGNAWFDGNMNNYVNFGEETSGPTRSCSTNWISGCSGGGGGGGTCGNNVCDSGETSASCPSDCGSSGYCGDGSCGSNESSSSCPSDCGGGGGGSCNNNGTCESNETYSSCPSDCGGGGGGGGGSYEGDASGECSNGVDDDGDGLIDSADPGCSGGGAFLAPNCPGGHLWNGAHCIQNQFAQSPMIAPTVNPKQNVAHFVAQINTVLYKIVKFFIPIR